MIDETQIAMWTVFKSLVGIVAQQQKAHAVVKERLDNLETALAAQFGWEPPQAPPQPTAEETEAMNRGIAELERMIGNEGETSCDTTTESGR